MRKMVCLLVALIAAAGLSGVEPTNPPPRDELVNTFSIVARDPDKKEWGVAVASRVFSVGAVVSYAKADVGAIATQSQANVTFGPRGLEMLAAGKSAQETLDALLKTDPLKEVRQVGIIDAEGRTANFTGAKCIPWAGAKSGANYSCQGNLLVGEDVVNKMAEAFEKTKGPLAWKLAAALEAGEEAGGDKRGKQSAGLLVVRDKAGWGGGNDRAIDLRVDDHENPIPELVRILNKLRPRGK